MSVGRRAKMPWRSTRATWGLSFGGTKSGYDFPINFEPVRHRVLFGVPDGVLLAPRLIGLVYKRLRPAFAPVALANQFPAPLFLV
jgi:hypothetical protein